MADNVRLAVLEEKVDNFGETIGSMSTDLRSISKDVGEMKLLIAKHQGASAALKYLTNAFVGIAGALIGIFASKH